jgi:energy-coupling factor transporter transmembrane protein EcfT
VEAATTHTRSLPAARPRLLLLCGLVAAVLGVAFLSVFDLSITSTRVEGIQRAQDVLEQGGPPLLAKIDGQYAPVGTTDDQGVYLYGSLIGWATGQEDPAISVKWMYLLLYALTLAIWPWAFYRLFESWAVAVAAPIAGIVLFGSAGLFDVYTATTWAIVTLIPVLFVLQRRWPRHGLLIMLGVCVAASFASSIRAQAGLPVALVALFLVAVRPWSWQRRAGAALLVLLAYLSIVPLAFAGVRAYRDGWVDDPNFGKGEPTSHPLWHNAYIGLGYLPNKWNLQWDDTDGIDTIRQVDPNARYLSKDYLHEARTLYFRIAKDEPVFYAKTQGAKFVVDMRHIARYAFFGALLLPLLLIRGPRRRQLRWWALALVPAAVLGLAQPIIALPDYSYESGLSGSVGLLVVLAGAAVLDPLLRVARRGPAAAVSEGRVFLRGLDRRIVLISAALLVFFAACWIAAHPIQTSAEHWLHSKPGPPLVP